ncbi:MAG: hypothetical protein CMF96_02900 [Candidatus Marinimicrobia bacterium]|nr:hypothetical protein [Candidatus Neomarinimicrobiota bacterium]|tara:strand:- start:233 stop:535 length:303 start_codon:yes stop_codon:yes gene_type:complete
MSSPDFIPLETETSRYYGEYRCQVVRDQNNKIKALEGQLTRAQEIIMDISKELASLKTIVDFRKSIQDFHTDDFQTKHKDSQTKIEDLRERVLRLEREVI